MNEKQKLVARFMEVLVPSWGDADVAPLVQRAEQMAEAVLGRNYKEIPNDQKVMAGELRKHVGWIFDSLKNVYIRSYSSDIPEGIAPILTYINEVLLKVSAHETGENQGSPQ